MISSKTMQTTSQPASALVWDPLVRFGHWALVAAFAVAYFSAEEEAGGPDPLHVWGGYVVGGIVVLRVLWGFVGPRHARFSDFVCGPIKALAYFRDLLMGRRTRRYVGHSPAGGAMVIALLICIAATVTTGLIHTESKARDCWQQGWSLTSIQTPVKRSAAASGGKRGAQRKCDRRTAWPIRGDHRGARDRAHLRGGVSQFRASGKYRPRDDQRQETPSTRLITLLFGRVARSPGPSSTGGVLAMLQVRSAQGSSGV